jgi:5-methylcytosine-specific restriction protein A
MTIEIFDVDDAPYFHWMQNNPEGFVLNTEKEEKTDFMMFHKANYCHHIGPYDSKQAQNPSYTSSKRIKVCSNDVHELYQWAKKHRQHAVTNYKICSTCKPPIPALLLTHEPLAEEITPDTYFEGVAKKIYINAYERNPKAREACLKIHGYCCAICGFDFAKNYGSEFEGLIHVHHCVPLASIKTDYAINPQTDLVPVCPNCHAVIHFKGETRSIEEVRALVAKNRV